MLRISETASSAAQVVLLLEGQISKHGVEITRDACEQALRGGGQLILDMAGVTFADRAGLSLLQELRQRHVQLMHCSPFLQEQLKTGTLI